MIRIIPDVLDADGVARLRAILDAADWIDGNATSGSQSALAKRNEQLPEGSEAARIAGDKVLDALAKSPLFVTAALPQTVFPPLFNRYGGGQTFATHIDNSIRQSRDGSVRIRSDLSATLFLSEPEDYDGGELEIEGPLGVQSVKLAAGDMILYPASSLHRVTPVTRGARIASFFWIESLVADEGQRTLLFDLDQAIQGMTPLAQTGDDYLLKLTGVYHNLVRRWAAT